MDDKQQGDKTPKPAPKSFMTAGPTLHYSHTNVLRCWLLAFAAYCLTCLLWSKVLTGSLFSCNLDSLTSTSLWHLGNAITAPISIFQYPWQILVLGTLMGILAIVPILISQLMSFSYSILFILAAGFLAGLPGLAVALVVCCVAVACRPLRFRSRFISVALCTASLLLYWGYFGRVGGAEPLQFGFSLAPWVCAWLVGLAMAGVVLAIGHFTRYKPGLVWLVTLIILVAAAVEFEMKIGFDELDYQLYIAKNDPEKISEFRDHSVKDALDRTVANRADVGYLEFYFYPDEPIALRAALKREMQEKLIWERWPAWFAVPDELKFAEKRQTLFAEYDKFIYLRPRSRRTSIALYYKGLLSEFSPDTEVLGRTEILHFYSDYPQDRSRAIWHELYSNFGDSPESIEARWRVARSWAGQGRFEHANKLLSEAHAMALERLAKLQQPEDNADGFFSLFTAPPDSVMTELELTELVVRIEQLRILIGPENQQNGDGAAQRLATFVMLNPHSPDYPMSLGELLRETGDNDPLRDNILLAQIKLIPDEETRADRLSQLHNDFPHSDAGTQALYELARLKLRLYQAESDQAVKNRRLAETRDILTSFVNLHPDSIFTAQARKNLAALPTPD
jgi:hypothetical protein